MEASEMKLAAVKWLAYKGSGLVLLAGATKQTNDQLEKIKIFWF